MTRVIVLYGTTDGHTRLIANALGDAFRMAGIEADEIRAATDDPSPRDYAAVIVAAPIHGGRYPRAVEQWVRAHAGELRQMPTAFVSSCLAIAHKASPGTMNDLGRIVDRFLKTTGWQPAVVKHVAGALMYTRYNVFKRWLMKRIVASQGGPTDATRDYVYTDWADLRAFAGEFRRRLASAA